MRILIWHVHGSWTTAFVQGPHDYLVPVLPERGPDGRGRAQTFNWPESVVEVSPEQARNADIDLVVLQRPNELESLCFEWTGRRPGSDVPAVYLEHNCPDLPLEGARHPAADRSDITTVHVTHFNELFWDSGVSPSVVIEHGIVDPGHLYTGEQASGVFVANEPARRGRVVGSDLLEGFRRIAPVDAFGMVSETIGGLDVAQEQLHRQMALRRVYLHLARWTSLGLSLIEAMQLGMPVLALATTEVPRAVDADAGVLTNDVAELHDAFRNLLRDPDAARAKGNVARTSALERYGLKRFLENWEALIWEVTR